MRRAEVLALDFELFLCVLLTAPTSCRLLRTEVTEAARCVPVLVDLLLGHFAECVQTLGFFDRDCHGWHGTAI
jgi:hypothetical protein